MNILSTRSFEKRADYYSAFFLLEALLTANQPTVFYFVNLKNKMPPTYSFIRLKSYAQPLEENQGNTELVLYWRKMENGGIAELFDLCILFSSKTKTMIWKNYL